jgi:hypothetical protein
MRAIDCNLGSIDEDTEADLNADELEVLSIMEHNRWWADRALNGWKFGSVRNDIQKVHPNMLPYDNLSEADKQKDRDSVLEMINILRGEGAIIVRN